MSVFFDFDDSQSDLVVAPDGSYRRAAPIGYRVFKLALDLAISALLLVILAISTLVLIVLNPIFNPGSLFFVQKRMGKDCKPFNVIKFRTMTAGEIKQRGADCPLEVDRITPLGHWLRKLRIDEIPQIINVLKREMSLIGPRPDAYNHAVHYVEHVPGYRERHTVLPGISGLAQTEVGYVQSTHATRKKVTADLYYIRHRSVALETWLVWRSAMVVFRREGS